MAAKLILAPEVEQDLAEAYDWYEERQAGLGEEFMRCIDAGLQAILRSPEMHPHVHADFRRGLVRRFPFSIFYKLADGTVTGYCITHNSRDPEKWRQRLS